MSTASATAEATETRSIRVVHGFTPMSCRGARSGNRSLGRGEVLPLVQELDGAFVVQHNGQQVTLRDDEVHDNCRVEEAEPARGLIDAPQGSEIDARLLLEATVGRREEECSGK